MTCGTRNRQRVILSEPCVRACETPSDDSDKAKLFSAVCEYFMHGVEPTFESEELTRIFETVLKPWTDAYVCSDDSRKDRAGHKTYTLPEEFRLERKPVNVRSYEIPALNSLVKKRGGNDDGA